MKLFLQRFAVVILTMVLTGCAGGVFLGEGAISSTISARIAATVTVNAVRNSIRTSGAAALAARGGVALEANLVRALAAGTITAASEGALLNVTATLRRGTRLGLTSAVIEEHCMMRAGSKLSLLDEASTFGRTKPLRLMSPQGNLIASATRNQNNVIIRNAKGGVVSNSYVAGDRVLHFTDGESKVFYGYSEIDTEKNLLRHYLIDANKKGVFVGQDEIVTVVGKDLKTSLVFRSGVSRGIGGYLSCRASSFQVGTS